MKASPRRLLQFDWKVWWMANGEGGSLGRTGACLSAAVYTASGGIEVLHVCGNTINNSHSQSYYTSVRVLVWGKVGGNIKNAWLVCITSIHTEESRLKKQSQPVVGDKPITCKLSRLGRKLQSSFFFCRLLRSCSVRVTWEEHWTKLIKR